VLDKVLIFVKVLILGYAKHCLKHKLYKRLQNKLDDDWPSLNNDDDAEFIYRVLWIKWEKNYNLYYLRGINSLEDYVYIKKMNDLVERLLARLSITELLISEFLQVLDCLQPSVDMP